ncbi:LOW QUALITY PROTEIN: schlafen family member 13-like [Polypterus senegalus]|uniref:LOW QUALITY PROTEIN: schlafen family member 13-like n=1 Tax=Polypterus senegalus TaxID=55291 RepID=UPI001964F75B|nr:LOW QUALITY PROTEIN: schlafen family member 13-like [Polypterus senegalus]
MFSKLNNIHLVKTAYADRVINVGEVLLGEHCRNKMKNQDRDIQRNHILRAACAHLNSGGGLIVMRVKNENYALSDGLGHDIEQGLRELVSPQTIQDNFAFLQQGTHVIIFVKSWTGGSRDTGSDKARICSIDCQAFKRCGTSTLRIAPNEFVGFFRQKHLNAGKICSPKRIKLSTPQDKILTQVIQFCAKQNVKVGEVVDFGESNYVELKSFEGKKFQNRLDESLRKYISAFGNTNGGIFFVGIHDKTKTVVGCGKDAKPELFKQIVEETMKKLTIVHFAHCSSQRDIEYKLHVINVTDDSEAHQGYVMALRVKKHCCVIFSKNPESFKIEGDDITSVTPGEWMQMMMGTDPVVQELCENFEKELSMASSPPQCKPVYGLKNTDRLDQLQKKIYPVQSEGIESIPPTLCARLKVERFDDKLKPNGEQGVLIFSRSWAVDIEMEKNDNVICDALLFCTNSFPVLYTVVEKATEELLEYSRQTACQIKQKLVNVGGYSEWICVIPQLFELQSRTVISSEANHSTLNLRNQYPENYHIVDVKAILRSLVLILLSFKSPLSDQLGCEFLNLLTIEQFEILNSKYNIEYFREMFVHGLPGTGKTVIAEMLIRRIQRTFHCRPEEVLYICENQPLREYMRRFEICRCETRSAFIASEFPDVKHIVVDEAHNFRKENTNWYTKARNIIHKRSNASGRGVFWIFLDYFQLNHPYPSGLPKIECQYPKVDLTLCVRNSKAIYSLMYEEMIQIMNGNFLRNRKSLHAHCIKQINEAKCGHSFQGFRKSICYKNHDGIAVHIFSIIQSKLKQGYTNKDFVILCNTKVDCKKYYDKLVPLFKKVRPPPVFSEAVAIYKNEIILDTVRRFSGLERNIVFVVHPEVHEKHRDLQDNFVLDAASRARVQLFVYTQEENSTEVNNKENEPITEFIQI